MQTLQSAYKCALISLILFSCHSKKINTATTNTVEAILKNDPVNAMRNFSLGIAAYNTGFNDRATQKFIVTQKRKTVIVAKGGLKVTVDPSILEKENGYPIDGKINVNIIELTTSADLFKSNAATLSNGRLLQSGGSYFVGMECNGEKLRIKNDKKISIDFPLLKHEKMELFYGERNALTDMNWEKAEIVLDEKTESVQFAETGFDPVNVDYGPSPEEIKKPKIYRSLNEDVYYYKKRMPLHELVDTLNRKSAKVYLQTISFWPKELRTDIQLDTNYLVSLYGPRKQYMLKTFFSDKQEKLALEKRKVQQQAMMENWQPKSLNGQIQKYYAPAQLGRLGWINCDRFYQIEKQAEVELDLPYTISNSRIEYFIVFKNFNGLINNRLDFKAQEKCSLQSMPVGEPVTLLAFTKKNGIIYQAKEDFVIEKNKKLIVNFKEISGTDMNKIFGSNVKI